MSTDTAPQILRAAQTCLACKKQKRKCDKQLPACSLCTRMSRTCDYTDNSPTPTSQDFADIQKKVHELENLLRAKNNGITPSSRSSPEENGNTNVNLIDSLPSSKAIRFPTSFFLDAEIFNQARLSVDRPTVSIPFNVSAAIGSILDIRDVVERYFPNVHTWLPIISRKRMTLNLQNPDLELTADFALLILSMKLITQEVNGNIEAALSPLYWTIKQYISFIESSALLSLHLLQAMVLTAAYEIGHAIYPAAYMTTGRCARLGNALGLNDRQNACQIVGKRGSWAEVEELRRVWWAVMLLDRVVSLGSPGHSLATEDPSRSDTLPADDLLWDEGEMTMSEPLYVYSPTSIRAGSFARTCQVTHLSGRLIRLLNDQTLDQSFRFSEALQLYRTLNALAKVLLDESKQDHTKLSTSLGICYTTLLHLCDEFACTESTRGENRIEETEMRLTAITGLKSTAEEILRFSQSVKADLFVNISGSSPLLVGCLYLGATTYAWLTYESGTREMAASYHDLRHTLTMMNSRWSVAGEYLRMLDLAREHLYDNNALL